MTFPGGTSTNVNSPYTDYQPQTKDTTAPNGLIVVSYGVMSEKLCIRNMSDSKAGASLRKPPKQG